MPRAGPNSTPVKLYGRTLTLALSLLAAIAVWLVAPAARASGPQCDIRGATVIAPSPTLDTQGGSIDATPDSCGATAIDRALQRDTSRSSPNVEEQGPRASLPELVRVRPATPTAALAPVEEASTLSPGVHDRVERPPRG